MTKAQQDRQQRRWLLQLAKGVAARIIESGAPPEIVINSPKQLRTETTNTDGWYVDLGRVRPDRGSGLQIWLDRWSNWRDRKVYVCYKGTRIDQVRRVAAAASKSLRRPVRFTEKESVYDRGRGFHHLRSPLPAALFGRPIAELYEDGGSWAFYGTYFRQAGWFGRRAGRALEKRAQQFLENTAKAVLGQLQKGPREEYAAIENRLRVTQHLRRERSARLAEAAKLRDGYTCQVCDFSFEVKYGPLGRGFAEAHHRVPLARLRAGNATRVRDLTTVCANCHRMLHRMKGKASDVLQLRRAVRRRS